MRARLCEDSARARYLSGLAIAIFILAVCANVVGLSAAASGQGVDLDALIVSSASRLDAVTIRGSQYYIVTLRQRIDPASLRVSGLPGQFDHVYLDGSRRLVRDSETIKKIALIDQVSHDPQMSPERIKVLSKNLDDQRDVYLRLATSDFLLRFPTKFVSALIDYAERNQPGALSALASIPLDVKPFVVLAGVDALQSAQSQYASALERRGRIQEYEEARGYLDNYLSGTFVYSPPAAQLLAGVSSIETRNEQTSYDLVVRELSREFMFKLGLDVEKMAPQLIKQELLRQAAQRGVEAGILVEKLYHEMFRIHSQLKTFTMQIDRQRQWVAAYLGSSTPQQYVSYTTALMNSRAALASLGSAAPGLSGVSPNPVPALTGQQSITLRGNGFIAGTRVTLRTGSEEYPIPAERTIVVGLSEIRVIVNVGSTAAMWTAEVATPSGASSNKVTFNVATEPASATAPVVRLEVSISPLAGTTGTLFSQPGQGFTPNSTATVFYRKPDGTTYPPVQQPTDGQGRYLRQWTPGPQAQVGTYQAWAVDDRSGQQSSVISYTVTALPAPLPPVPGASPGVSTPQVFVSPASGPRGTTFRQPGQGFTPNGTATVYYQKPDGTMYPPVSQPIDSRGAYSRQWTPDSLAMLGTYRAWAVDDRTGLKSSSVSYVLTGSPTSVRPNVTAGSTGGGAALVVNPFVSVSPSSGSRITIFFQPGQGFTPNSTATVYYQKPDGTTYPPVKQPTDASGRYQRQWTPGSQALLGTYQAWAVDDRTGQRSQTVTYTVTGR